MGAKAKTLAPPTARGSGVGELDRTVQPSGTLTVKVKEALRSGCSKTVKTRRASGTSNWEYR